MQILGRIRARISLAWSEARFARDQLKAGVPVEMIIRDSTERAFGEERKE